MHIDVGEGGNIGVAGHEAPDPGVDALSAQIGTVGSRKKWGAGLGLYGLFPTWGPFSRRCRSPRPDPRGHMTGKVQVFDHQGRDRSLHGPKFQVKPEPKAMGVRGDTVSSTSSSWTVGDPCVCLSFGHVIAPSSAWKRMFCFWAFFYCPVGHPLFCMVSRSDT